MQGVIIQHKGGIFRRMAGHCRKAFRLQRQLKHIAEKRRPVFRSTTCIKTSSASLSQDGFLLKAKSSPLRRYNLIDGSIAC
ncbi:hypothetical protein DBA26_15640 [Brucella canis]|uniref:Uncharacterized protein n=6 Tax=Brucella TaxID=234 RepID=A0AAI8H7C4_BRUSS|nr:hypothetical protein BR0447 [Brucella suis 1330]AEU05471.1 hypothetical protein BSVBI22_A0448 [Brucella suis VBI22]AHN46099.1 hypothetical protein BSS2_I0436 [Brucella suis bv. 1 str. S2]ATN21357.1 hypothetical protein CRN66_09525 [Brucella canis]ATQ53088.1 hypothetical protein CS875_02245 [Brucella suis]EEX86899.1 predicted protein [Brucella ceti B1/94]EEY04052.1 predicted protein [Brucella neotomae 5K33]EEZ08082.1 predicted protein [Brucella ceti M490/95/1]EEZ30617.1 predicted protein 